MFSKGLILLTAAFSISTAQAATSGDNQWDVYGFKTYKVDGRLIGVSEQGRAVAIVCGVLSADIVEPNARGELNFAGYDASGRTPAVNRAKYRTIAGADKARICDAKNDTFTIAINGDKVAVLKAVASNSN